MKQTLKKQGDRLCVALAGNPNTGKTSLFNALTGERQHVGNYPGVTVEKRVGHHALEDKARLEIHDLPGTYSLNAYSPEERIAQDEILSGQYHVVVAVADASNLHRSLVLLAQLMHLKIPLVLALNMSDEAKAAGQVIDLELMRDLLGMPVVETVGHRRAGIAALTRAIQEASAMTPSARLVLGRRMERALEEIEAAMPTEGIPEHARRWLATRLLLDDAGLDEVGLEIDAAVYQAARRARRRVRTETRQEIDVFVSERYFGFVDGLLKEVIQIRSRGDSRRFSDRVDRVVAHRIFGLPIFAALMYLIFWLTFSIGELPMGWIEAGFEALSGWISGRWPGESPLKSLIIDGMIGGVGGVLVFLPNILLLFMGLAFLEDTGYLSRAAFLMDRVMHRFGLHGKSFIPMVTGFGCTIPGVMATRTLENERDRLTTMMVLPLMSCGARLPIWLLIIPALFAPEWQAFMLWFIYGFGILLALLLARLLRGTLLKGEEAPFVMELPPYRLPTLRAVSGAMIERGGLYVQKAGTIILAISILMWLATAYPKPASMPEGLSEDEQAALALEQSAAGQLGRALEPVFSPLGFDWRINTALIGAFAAKEVFVAQMGIVNALGETDEGSKDLRAKLRDRYPPLVGLSLMIFLLIATPCMATFAVVRRESNSWRWPTLQLVGLTVIAYLLALVVYQVGRLIT
ncbi:ferrous iron transport protein B [Myxococcota bacterium]|nr:ferrous iron transport protein B [Myxococcota bacterium]MBU1432469.1 ferrous iron transport protein B [Myxococcota bacterium]MBU1900403.1 ferrous iron transport protein B [Myxococcota bacterium]